MQQFVVYVDLVIVVFGLNYKKKKIWRVRNGAAVYLETERPWLFKYIFKYEPYSS